MAGWLADWLTGYQNDCWQKHIFFEGMLIWRRRKKVCLSIALRWKHKRRREREKKDRRFFLFSNTACLPACLPVCLPACLYSHRMSYYRGPSFSFCPALRVSLAEQKTGHRFFNKKKCSWKSLRRKRNLFHYIRRWFLNSTDGLVSFFHES